MAGEAANAFQVADVAPEPEHGDPVADPSTTEHGSEELHTSTEHAGDAHGAKPGLPQLDTTTFASQLFWLLISFAILYFVISRIAAPKIGGVIADRANRIKTDLDTAAQAKRDSEAAMAGYDKALADARAKALKSSAAARAEAEQQAIAARETLREQVAALAVKGAEQILRKEVNAGVHADLLSRLKTEP